MTTSVVSDQSHWDWMKTRDFCRGTYTNKLLKSRAYYNNNNNNKHIHHHPTHRHTHPTHTRARAQQQQQQMGGGWVWMVGVREQIGFTA